MAGPLFGPRRRALLLGAAGAVTGALLTGGCTDSTTPETRTAARQRSAGERARGRAAGESAALVVQYGAVLAAHPALGPRLAPLRAEVARHAAAFGGAGGTTSAQSAPSSAAAGSTPGAGRSGAGAVPVGERDALEMLAAAERALAGRRAEALLEVPGELARLLASVAAAGAAHAYLLSEHTEGAPPAASPTHDHEAPGEHETPKDTDGQRAAAPDGEPQDASGQGTESRDAELEAVQAALAAEHAAVYGYGVVGGKIDGAGRSAARAAYDTHRAHRDDLARTARDLGGTPQAAAAAYALPFTVADTAAAVRLAAELEGRVAGAYADLVRAGIGARRRGAADALQDAAVRATRWRGGSVAFPGLAERATATPDSSGTPQPPPRP